MALTLNSNFACRLRDALDDGKASALAEEIGLSKQAISMYINGKRTPKQPTIEAIARALDVNPMWLLGYDVPKRTKDVKSPSGDIFSLKIKGHSMEPRIFDGDTVIVKKQDDVESGEIAVVEIDGKVTTKKVIKQENGIMLVGLNAAAFSPKFYSYNQIKIIGKVIEIRGNVDGWNK